MFTVVTSFVFNNDCKAPIKGSIKIGKVDPSIFDVLLVFGVGPLRTFVLAHVSMYIIMDMAAKVL